MESFSQIIDPETDQVIDTSTSHGKLIIKNYCLKKQHFTLQNIEKMHLTKQLRMIFKLLFLMMGCKIIQ